MPLQLPYLVDLLLTIPAAVAIVLIPETVRRREWRWRMQRVSIPPPVRAVFIPAALSGFCGFAVFGVF